MEQIVQFATNHWELCLALLVILILIYVNEMLSQKKRAKELSPEAAVEMINHESAIVIDIRDQELYQKGHIIDSVRVSADDFNKKSLEKYKTKPIIIVCAKGIQAAALAAKLRTQEFTQPMVLAGGFAAWLSAGLPVVKGTTTKAKTKTKTKTK